MFRMHRDPPPNGEALEDSEILIIRRMLDTLAPSVGQHAPAEAQPFDTTKRFVSEQRSIAEVLLREFVEIEEHLELQTDVRDANAAYAAALKQTDDLTATVEQARAALTKYEAELAAATKEAQRLKERADGLERDTLSETGQRLDRVAKLAGKLADLKP